MTKAILLAVLLAGAVPAAAMAETAPAAPPTLGLDKWPLPDTLSAEGKAAAAAAARQAMPDPLPPIADIRAFIGTLQATMGAALQKRYEVRVEAATIAGIPVRIVYPKGVSALGKGPVLLNLHGGGFAIDSGSLTETIPIAARTGLPVVAVLYRLAPEHPYPAALDDALAVYQALEKDRKAKSIAVFGTSAGACLSGQLMARLAGMGRPMPAALAFLSGSADLSLRGDSESWLPGPGFDWVASYAGQTPLADPILSPLHGDVSRFPPTLLMTSSRDFLLSPTAILARKLTEQGVDARLVMFDGLPHAFWAYMAISESDQANELVARFLKDRLAAATR
ncbi:acetyl esterase/lipase [Sphingopyxis panaciterrae]|uniref:alpha/beta hydrolase n=1 Tax=Sphingopyxis panaciterrae TaxID=363841 RepID=UPI00142253D2|nr:alpha/beta hydrolase fold domain-containing protein [Sphingopyxis panaciterrae]NIJ39716.1 acetyl esterase/lipase [Sphingopyxis panaciterrae]